MKIYKISRTDYVGVIGRRSHDVDIRPATEDSHCDIWGENYSLYYCGFVVYGDLVDWTEKPSSEEIEAVNHYIYQNYGFKPRMHTQWHEILCRQ